MIIRTEHPYSVGVGLELHHEKLLSHATDAVCLVDAEQLAVVLFRLYVVIDTEQGSMGDGKLRLGPMSRHDDQERHTPRPVLDVPL